MISPAAHGPSAAGQSAVRRPSAARGPGRGGRLLNQLSSVCQLCVGTYRFARDYGCVHPGMPLRRKHLRRIRGAPTVTTRARLRPCGWSKNYFYVRREVAGSQLPIGCRIDTKDSQASIRLNPPLDFARGRLYVVFKLLLHKRTGQFPASCLPVRHPNRGGYV